MARTTIVPALLVFVACSSGGSPAGDDTNTTSGGGGGGGDDNVTLPLDDDGSPGTSAAASTGAGETAAVSSSGADTSATSADASTGIADTGEATGSTTTATGERGSSSGGGSEGGSAGACVDEDLGSALPASADGSNVGAGDDDKGDCVAGVGGLDVIYEWTAPQAGEVLVTTIGDATDFDTVLYVLDACDGTQLACGDDYDNGISSDSASMLTLAVEDGQTVAIVVDGYSAMATGAFALTILPVPAADTDGGSCCTSSQDAGCAVADIEACTCAIDPFCCNDASGAWDSTCITQATETCNMAC